MTSGGRAGCTHDRRCYALILPATFAGPRHGEATALRRCDLDLDEHVRVRPADAERSTGKMLLGPPKPKPGRRIASMPDAIIAALREHLPGCRDGTLHSRL
jgi:integrase